MVRTQNEAGSDHDDRTLVAAIATGDSEAMARLYDRHRLRVYRFTLRYVPDSAAAEDLTNDVFIDVWRQAGRYEGRAKVSTWILGMARFKAISLRRKDRDVVDPDEVLGQIEDNADTPDIVAQKNDKGMALKKCITQLSPEQRAVVDLVYYHDKSVRETAEIVGASENTVKSRMFHARKNLTHLMSKAGIDRGWP